MRTEIIEILKNHTREMEGYSYFGSNPGISEDDYEEIAGEICAKFNVPDGIHCTECEEEISNDGDGHNSRCNSFGKPLPHVEIKPHPNDWLGGF